jgi:hypothetical protein
MKTNGDRLKFVFRILDEVWLDFWDYEENLIERRGFGDIGYEEIKKIALRRWRVYKNLVALLYRMNGALDQRQKADRIEYKKDLDRMNKFKEEHIDNQQN